MFRRPSSRTRSLAHFPERILAPYEWIGMFERAEFSIDGKPTSAPTEPLTLFRGATEAGREGMSWTSDRAVAERFATGVPMRALGQVLAATVPPHALLVNLNSREEAEWVAHPDYLGEILAG